MKLAAGTAAAQLLTALATPLLTRLYDAEAFGVYALFITISSLFTLVSCSRYETALMLPPHDCEAANLLGACFLSLLTVSCLVWGICHFGGDAISSLLKAPDLRQGLWLVPLAVLFGGVTLALRYWHSREKRFGQLAQAELAGAATGNTWQLIAGAAGSVSPGPLIAGRVAGSGLWALLLAAAFWRRDGLRPWRRVTLPGIWSGMRRYSKFPLYSTGATLLNYLSWQLPVLFLSRFFSTSAVGYFVVGQQFLRLPMGLVANSVSTVFYQHATRSERDGTFRKRVEAIYRSLVRISLFPLLILTVVGAEVFGFVFGTEWTEAGVYSQILAIWTFFWFISTPLCTYLFYTLERQESELRIQAAILVTRLTTLGIGAYLGDARLTIALYALGGIGVYGYLGWTVLRVVGVPPSAITKVFLPNLAAAVPAMGGLLALRIAGVASPLVVVCSVGAILVYYFFLARSDPLIRSLGRGFRDRYLKGSARRDAGGP